MPDNMGIWNAMNRPPASALKTIKGGRLKGMTDVNPQWRYQAMTEQFGPCGVGWKYEITKLWNESSSDGQVLAFATVNVYIGVSDGAWSEPIPGIGGSAMVAKETAGLRGSDECYKMAVTDALSVALKMLGLAADIYAGRWDGTKYKDIEPEPDKKDTIKQPTPKRKMADALKSKGLSDYELVSLANYLKGMNENGTLTEDTMIDVAEKTDAYINEWKEFLSNQSFDEIPFD